MCRQESKGLSWSWRSIQRLQRYPQHLHLSSLPSPLLTLLSDGLACQAHEMWPQPQAIHASALNPRGKCEFPYWISQERAYWFSLLLTGLHSHPWNNHCGSGESSVPRPHLNDTEQESGWGGAPNCWCWQRGERTVGSPKSRMSNPRFYLQVQKLSNIFCFCFNIPLCVLQSTTGYHRHLTQSSQ